MSQTPEGSTSKESETPLALDGHLATIEVRDFKALKHVEVELGRVNVFVGANGAGKSCLLEAIGVLGACAAGTVDDQALLRRGVRPGVPELYKSSFAGEQTQPKISLRATSVAGAEYHAYITNPIATPSPEWFFGNETLALAGNRIASRGPKGLATAGSLRLRVESKRSVAPLVRADDQTDPRLRIFLDTLDGFAIYAPVTPVLRGIAPDPAQRSPVGLYGGQLAEAIGRWRMHYPAAVLDRALTLIDWAKKVEPGEASRLVSPSVPTSRHVVEFVDRFMAPKRNLLSGYDASEGALYILFLLVLASHIESPPVFAVDNFDQALNPRTARALTRMFVEEVLRTDRQTLLTTHNPLVLDGLALGDDRVRLFAVSRDRKGHAVVRRIPVKDFEALKKKHGEHAVSRLWIEGRLGGMPDDV